MAQGADALRRVRARARVLLREHPAVLTALAVALTSLVVSVPRVCRGVALVGDSPEMVAAPASLGISHAPGYPLYVLLARLAVLMPGGTLPWRVNLTSAVWHAVAAALAAGWAVRMTRSAAAGLATGLTLTLAKLFLLGSLYAEVFPLNDLLFTLALLLAWEVRRRFDAHGPGAANRWLLALAALTGVACSHHQMIVLATPALLVWTAAPLAAAVRRKPLHLAALAGALLVPFAAIYAAVPLLAAREPVLSWGDVHDATSLLHLVTRADYGGLLSPSRSAASASVVARLGGFADRLFDSFGPFGLLLAFAGALAALRRRPWDAAALLLAAAFAGPLFASLDPLFAAKDPAGVSSAGRFTTMCHVPIALLVGEAVGWIHTTGRTRTWTAVGCTIAGLAGIVAAARSWRVDLHADRTGPALVSDLLRGTPDDAVVLVGGDVWTQAAGYACAVDNSCGNRIVFSPGMLFMPWYAAQVARRNPSFDAIRGVHTIRDTHLIVERAVGRRPVFVLPHLLVKDPSLSARPLLPSLLLFRLYASAAERDLDLERFRRQCEALADGRDCDGCSLQRADLREPSFADQVIQSYAAALQNHARFARSQLRDEALAARLERRAEAMMHERR